MIMSLRKSKISHVLFWSSVVYTIGFLKYIGIKKQTFIAENVQTILANFVALVSLPLAIILFIFWVIKKIQKQDAGLGIKLLIVVPISYGITWWIVMMYLLNATLG